MSFPQSLRRLNAALVHLFTASGAAIGLLALDAAFDRRFPAMFAWLGVALIIDGIDGTFARLARVKEVMPEIDGDVLDLVVDFLTYVVGPAVALWRGDLLPPQLALPLTLGVVAASALYFADTRMKTRDLWFRGFPAIWNVLVFYLLVFRLDARFNAAIVFAALLLMFAPIVFVHPLRVERLRALTLGVTGLFAILAILAVWQDLQPANPVVWGLAGCAVYVLALPLTRGRSSRELKA